MINLPTPEQYAAAHAVYLNTVQDLSNAHQKIVAQGKRIAELEGQNAELRRLAEERDYYFQEFTRVDTQFMSFQQLTADAAQRMRRTPRAEPEGQPQEEPRGDGVDLGALETKIATPEKKAA